MSAPRFDDAEAFVQAEALAPPRIPWEPPEYEHTDRVADQALDDWESEQEARRG